MSGRSAYVRKKITETKTGEQQGHGRGRAKSTTSSDNATIGDYPIDSMPALRQERHLVTGVGTTNARFLKFSEHAREDELTAYRGDVPPYVPQGSGSQSGSSVDGRRDGASTSQHNRPLNDFAYARARRPVIKTEDVSGIEKSGLRSMLDKRSDDFRKGLAKTFAFKKKDKKGSNLDKPANFRPESSATVRPSPVSADSNDGYDADISPTQYQPSGPHPGVPWDDTGLLSPPPSGKLAPTPGSSGAPPIKRWIGAGRPVQRWNKLRKDPELWDHNGDVLVFFGTKGQSPRPNPSFRLSSHIIEATESRYLITLLREGLTEEDIHLPPSPAGAPPVLQRHDGHGQHLTAGGMGRGGHPTSPALEDNSWEAEGQISYEMYFQTPVNMSKLDQFRLHITTRNVFAMLYHTSLVGFSLYQALTDLHSRLESYMPPESDNVGTILNYLSARGIDDVRNDPETAVSLLAWSEESDVRWEEGWRESFLHCAGMYSCLERCSDFRHVTPITRALLERACLETHLRVQAAEERLATFQYSDMWPAAVATTANASGPVGAAPAKAAADRLQNFFIQYYTREYGSWPPPLARPGGDPYAVAMAKGIAEEEEDIWLTRTVAQSLQKDFAALYDYLVNRDIVWDVSEARSSRKWMMVSESGNGAFEADSEDLPMTDMLIEFDNKHRFPHIPHPYPLVPESIPPPDNPSKDTSFPSGGGMFGNKSSKKPPATTSTRAGALDRRIQLAYTEATNICILGSDFTHSDLIDAFSKFEKSDKIAEVDPARRGRWVLVYGILQTLASVSVDVPNVRHRDNVTYHLSPRLKGNTKLPPWKTSGHNHFSEASHKQSHCWTISQTWQTSPQHEGGGSSSATNSGAEENSTDEQDDTYSTNSPIYAYGGRSYNFPLPSLSSRAASSVGGYRSNNNKSLRSGSSRAPSHTFSSAASVMSYSESDAGNSSIWSPPPSSAGGGGSRRVTLRRRDNAKIGVAPGGNGGRYIGRVGEGEWAAAPGQTYASRPGTEAGYNNNNSNRGIEEGKEVNDGGGFITAYTSRGRGEMEGSRVRGIGRGGNAGRREDDGGPPPVIRDFDFDGLDDVI
ncbi:hypothetical protein QBC40DRAFT_219187 [Triangularia verruculosa]|uniref:DUF8004 domain-containing protein n=1 Tax=Triangularia verruculosa TaxID=2587418 RepID=A0AAN7AYH2_9PEZI|nr:hypothetical protein QBC40DRAFT_219187 [Triangularia verruculosa]